MTTINLEKSLIRENKKLAMPKELLLINEYDKFTGLTENDALTRVGLSQTLKQGRLIKERIDIKREQTKEYNQERVFHISQIKGICEKYHLRFLPTRKYRGIIDAELPNRISNFEIAYNVKCTGYNTKIIAPIQSFELEKKPKDPLMFYEINNEYFYLIHKWGNDLNIFRAIIPYLCFPIVCVLIASLIFTLPLLAFGAKVYLIASAIVLFATGLWNILSFDDDDEKFVFFKKNDWDSEYE